MKKDIQTIQDIEFLVNTFYDKVKRSDKIAHFFNDLMVIDWDEHMPRMYAFWSDVLLGTKNFTGNPMTKHIQLNKLSEMKKEHFDEWLSIWESNLNLHFQGTKADEALSRAKSIAGIMLLKVST